MEERKIELLEDVANALATPKAPQGKTPSFFAMYVVDKLKQMDARSRAITGKRIMDILFELEMGTTCLTPTQRQHSISMRPIEAQYSNATTPVRGQNLSGMRSAEAQYLNATTPVQGQYSSGRPQTQNSWMDLLHND